MKKFLLLALLLTVVLGMQAQNGKRLLVTYFSWSGSTKNLAEEIQRQTNADIYRIEPLVPYTDDYQELAYQISNKEKEENARPALKDTLSSLNDYDIIFVGCPVWWYDAPMIIHSFLECKDYNFAGKTIVPFAHTPQRPTRHSTTSQMRHPTLNILQVSAPVVHKTATVRWWKVGSTALA